MVALARFSQALGSIDQYYFWKGRVALYALLKSCGVAPGDEVVMQAFTCVAVPNPVIYLGAKPIYVDVDPQTYTMSVAGLHDAITEKTKVIIVQNSFGHPPDYKPILKLAQSKNIVVIGDCAHGMGARYDGDYDGFLADASIYSFQWTKPVTTGLGGMAVVKNAEKFPFLADTIRDEFHYPALNDQLMLRIQYLVHKVLLHPRSYWSLIALYRLLSRMGLKVASSSAEELTMDTMPDGFAKTMSNWQQRNVAVKMEKLEEIVLKRRETAEYYDSVCIEIGIEAAFQAEGSYHSYLRYPIKVASSALAFDMAKKNRIQIGEWFKEPVDPSLGNEIRFHYRRGSCPVAELLCKRVINLPTDNPLTKKELLSLIS